MGGSPHTPADISHLLIRALGCWHFAHCNDFMVVTSPGQKKEVMEANSKGPDIPDHVVTYSSFQGKRITAGGYRLAFSVADVVLPEISGYGTFVKLKSVLKTTVSGPRQNGS